MLASEVQVWELFRAELGLLDEGLFSLHEEFVGVPVNVKAGF